MSKTYKWILGSVTGLGCGLGILAASAITVPALACYAIMGGTGLGAVSGIALAEVATSDEDNNDSRKS